MQYYSLLVIFLYMHFVRGNEGEGILTNDGEQKSTLKLTEKEPPLRIFTNQELAKYDGSDVSLIF